MIGLWQGFAAVWRGAGLLLRTPALRRLAVMPALLSLLLFAVLAGVSVRYGPHLIGHWGAGFWHHALAGALRFVLVLLLLAFSGVMTFQASNVIAQPFLDPLSRAAERAVEAAPPDRPITWREAFVLVGDVSVDLCALILAEAVVLAVWLIPAVGGPLHLALSWLVAAWFSGAAMVCSSLCRRGYRGRARWAAMRAVAPWVWGVGVATTLLFIVPLAQLLTLPIAVIGGSLAVVDAEQRGKLP
jgi:CysZ protein